MKRGLRHKMGGVYQLLGRFIAPAISWPQLNAFLPLQVLPLSRASRYRLSPRRAVLPFPLAPVAFCFAFCFTAEIPRGYSVVVALCLLTLK